MANIKTPESLADMPLAVVKNMITLATSGFGVVVALAWNQVIQKVVETYIDPYLGKNSGMVSLLIYAVVMTILAVSVTMQLAALEKQMTVLNEKLLKKNLQEECSDIEESEKKSSSSKK